MFVELNTYSGFNNWARYYFLKFLPPVFYNYFAQYFYKIDKNAFNKNAGFDSINLKQPKTFTEKLNYLKLYGDLENKSKFTDKLWVKEYIKQNIPELNVAKVYQSASSFENLDFESLPQSFIIKTNHACKTGIIINNKNSITSKKYDFYKKYYKKVLKINYAFWGTLELHYKNIEPKVYVEELIQNDNDDTLDEYQVYCLNGKPEFIQVTVYRNGLRYIFFFDSKWQKNSYGLFFGGDDNEVPNKEIQEQIIHFAEILSKNFKFVRVDFFVAKKKVWFCEMTFTPFAGAIRFSPAKYNAILGEKLVI